MASSTITYSTMFVVTLIMAGAMAIAWASFGRPRHALSWSIAYGLYGIELILSTVGGLVGGTLAPLFWSLALLMILISAVMLTIGARQRAGLPTGARGLAIAVGATFAAALAISAVPAAARFTSVTASLFTFATLPLTLAAVWPRGRRPDPAECATVATLGAFILFEVVLIACNVARNIYPDDVMLRTLYHDAYLVGLIPVFVANGIAVVLLLASDLAAKLRAQASHDPLTGILNRRGFDEAASRAIANGRRQRQSIAIAIADIDHFKSINDRFGHTAGDRTLHYICKRLAAGLRTGDLVGRVGGEEFALLLVNSTAEQAAQAMERIRVEVATGFSEDGAPVPVTISFGVAAIDIASGSAETALSDACDEADRALYRSKLDGRNRTTLAPPVAVAA